MIFSADAVAETVEVHETDTSPVKTMAVLLSTGPKVHLGGELTQEDIPLRSPDKVLAILM